MDQTCQVFKTWQVSVVDRSQWLPGTLAHAGPNKTVYNPGMNGEEVPADSEN
jgi:hypothetical protein